MFDRLSEARTMGVWPFLRGYQATDSNGLVTFETIFPGGIRGTYGSHSRRDRTFSSSGTQTFEFTTQLFFDPALTLEIMAQSPYNTRGTPDTSNSEDNIYHSETLLSLSTASSGGYTTSMTLGVETS